MVLPTVFLIHSATLRNRTSTGTLNEYGEPVFTTTDTTVACRFVSGQKRLSDGGQGKSSSVMLISTPRVLFAPTVSVAENDLLISTESGYAETFGIKTVNTVYEAAQKVISHYSCEIAAVV